METKKETSVTAGEKQVSITRVFDAPRQLVFDAWTDPKHLLRWYAPDNCSIKIKEIEVMPGGEFLHCISTPQFGDCWCKGVYIEVKRPERLVFTMTVTNENGEDVASADVGHDHEWPVQTTVMVIFTERDGKTTMTLQQTVSEALAKKTGAYPSWLQILDNLERELALSIGHL
jgi:uncharacterized protein YndB with AHSA1/START domain